MHNIRTNFIKILEVIKDIIGDEINEKGNCLRRGSIPKFSDITVIALSLTAECLSIDSENHLFSKLKKEYLNDFENLISTRQYNDRRKLLFEKTERIRKSMAEQPNRQSDVFAKDWMPLEICKISREQRNKNGQRTGTSFTRQRPLCITEKILLWLSITQCLFRSRSDTIIGFNQGKCT